MADTVQEVREHRIEIAASDLACAAGVAVPLAVACTALPPGWSRSSILVARLLGRVEVMRADADLLVALLSARVPSAEDDQQSFGGA